MKQISVIIFTIIASSTVFADAERIPASYSNPDQIRAEISRLRSEAVGKDGKPNPRVINEISKRENILSELKFKKEGRSNR